MAKIVRVLVKSSGKIVSLEENAAQRMAKAAPNEYQVLEMPKIEVTSIPEKKSAGLAAELNVGDAVPESLKVKQAPVTATTQSVLKKSK